MLYAEPEPSARSVIPFDGRAILAVTLPVEEPRFGGPGKDAGWCTDPMMFAVPVPFLRSIGPLNGRAIISMKDAVAVPHPCSVAQFFGMAIITME